MSESCVVWSFRRNRSGKPYRLLAKHHPDTYQPYSLTFQSPVSYSRLPPISWWDGRTIFFANFDGLLRHLSLVEDISDSLLPLEEDVFGAVLSGGVDVI